ncbi:TetR family transcriptional regulator [Actinoplanes sp. OR16]|uniref:TetR/AcrR family transcriptional regulator n=1 Tax=Actinoplanes sp. OR16 TaxID=946334 RepID=UPI000F71D52C|nr:TetR/AcrR family transcriptional regulator [Actinoplanes sp. OR16]BBH69702.1 TetR family transcriptional regulator [Actinoplanes sp. OR16]
MPRGVAVPEARQHLFAALERVMAAEGPLTSRAVTQEAGVATGLLFTHFRNFDGFLVAYAVDRSFQIAGELAATLGEIGHGTPPPSRDTPGHGTVAGAPPSRDAIRHGTVARTLSDAILAMPRPSVLALLRLTALRPSITAEVAAVLGPETAGLRALTHAVGRYLRAEQDHGRVPADTDTESLALAVSGVVLTVALTAPGDTESATRRAIATILPDDLVAPATPPEALAALAVRPENLVRETDDYAID